MSIGEHFCMEFIRKRHKARNDCDFVQKNLYGKEVLTWYYKIVEVLISKLLKTGRIT